MITIFQKTQVMLSTMALTSLCALPGMAQETSSVNADLKVDSNSVSSASSAKSGQGAAGSDIDVAMSSRLDSTIDKALAAKKIVGTVVIVSRDGKIIYRRAAGLADRENNVAVKPDTIFRLASMSKTIVSAAALSMVQSGKLKLDDPVTKWLPEFRPKLADGSTPEITIRELLTHTSGLNYRFSEPDDGPYHKANVSDGMDQPGLSFQENLKRIGSCPLLFSPGTRFHYSLSIDVLGAVLEKVAGKSLSEVIKDTVTLPLDMKDTAFSATDKSRIACPYIDGTTEPKRMGETEILKSTHTDTRYSPGRAFDANSYPSGGAGLIGTADDYIKFLEAIRTDNEKLLNHQTMFFLKLNQIGDLKAQESPGWGFGYGSGVMFRTEKKYPYSVGTLEWGGAYGCHWFMDPVQRLSVVELSNTAMEGLNGSYARDITNGVYNFTPPDRNN